MKLRFPLIAILICLLFLSSFNSSIYTDQEIGAIDESSRIIESPYVLAYDDHGPIFIAGDDNLTAWGFPGSGSLGEPFRIEGYNFTLNGTAISITNVSLHVLITGCWIQSAGNKTGNGIYFENVTSGRIENCIIMDKTYGIHLFESYSCTIFDIEVTGTTTYGVFFDTSYDCEIDESYIHHTSNMGIMDEGTRTIVSDTIIRHVSVNGIYSMGTNITITGCEISYSSQRGIRNEAWYGIFSDNDIFYNSWDGIYDRTSRYNTFSNNRIFGNGWAGICAYVSRYETYTGNTIFNNDVGFTQTGTSFSGDSEFYPNSVGWNTVANALHDAGIPNDYDDGVSVGNAWSDYGGTPTYYSIGGIYGGIDNYPTVLSDSIAPSVLAGPSDVFMSEIETKEITWIVFPEMFPDTYTVSINGSGTPMKWDGKNIDYSLEGLAPGVYLCELEVEDCSGQTGTDSILVEVYAFTINSPDDMVIETVFGNTIQWFAAASVQNYYEIYVDGSLVVTSDWDSWNIVYELDSLSYGLNEVEIRVYNSTGHFLSDIVLVTIVDTIDPTINNLGIYYLEKDSTQMLTWTISDANPSELTLWKNGAIYLQTTWDFPTFSIEIVGDEVGTWNYTLEIVDLAEQTAVDTAIIIVRDTSPTTTEPTTTTSTNDTQINQLAEQVSTQTLLIGVIGALAVISLLFNIVSFRKIGKKGK
ncbi:MAG: right-handed parallel beta-helix repeat-containing protein [Candidatus Thorarchaeota archaeon]